MIQAKNYDWKDSNLALFGSDVEKQVKKESAETETAWKGTESMNNELRIWRIVKFKVTHWPKEDYGRFYQGDSYIILNAYTTPGQDDIKYDVHFWIGKESTQDEYGTAAYKTVELDTYLDDKPIQHREVQGHESALFKSYFSKLEYWQGGADTGFRSVKTREYEPRLFHFHGERKGGVFIKQVGPSVNNLDDTDVFILDSYSNIVSWFGSKCNKDEKFRAAQYVNELKNNRGSVKVDIIDLSEDKPSSSHYFYKTLSNDPKDDEDHTNIDTTEKVLYKLSDASGTLEFSKLPEFSMSLIDDEDVFIVDNGSAVYVYVGPGCSPAEKKNAMSYAHKYLQTTTHPLVPVTVLSNKNADQLTACFA